MSEQTDKVTLDLDYVKSYMNKKYDLIYIDYRDDLDERLEEVQKSIQTQDWSPLDENLDEWFMNSRDDSVDCIIKELKEEIIKEEDFEEDEIDSFFEENFDEIRYEIEERDDSDPIKDLIRNTPDPVMFYDTGLWCDEPYDHEGVMETLIAIKELLDINDDKYDDTLDMMIAQASYGGRFVVYFRGDIKEMMDLEGKNVIQFKDASIAIIDNSNGSGDSCELVGLTFSLPFIPENVFIDKTVKYNYTYEVCGMSSNWCEGTSVKFLTVKDTNEAERSSLHAFTDREARLNKTFKDGGCTAGDMDMNRHRNTYYLNDYPCGTHCPKCHTFWID